VIATFVALATPLAALAIAARAVALIVLYRALRTTENALLCAGLYTLAAAVGDLLFSRPLAGAAVHAVIGFVLSFGLFFALSRIDHLPYRLTLAVAGLGIAFV
jgi:hypothetical protein